MQLNSGLPLFSCDLVLEISTKIPPLFSNGELLLKRDLAGYLIYKDGEEYKRIITSEYLMYPTFFNMNSSSIEKQIQRYNKIIPSEEPLSLNSIPLLNDVFFPSNEATISDSKIEKLIRYIEVNDEKDHWEIYSYLYSSNVFQIPELGSFNSNFQTLKGRKFHGEIESNGWYWNGGVKLKQQVF